MPIDPTHEVYSILFFMTFSERKNAKRDYHLRLKRPDPLIYIKISPKKVR
ncbi:hypothetical protein JM93_01056 [Roseibium hamelinense]|uniref:Uncharacterized protein n=1 Tax=Roseibium hamelinense TaxID=150831 RepID=A0A562T914_9HYPH|nr:hypothetical protein JM93_01056 [Roseibium hamelinense]